MAASIIPFKSDYLDVYDQLHVLSAKLEQS